MNKPKLHKQSKNPLPKLRRKAWKIFATYIKKRDYIVKLEDFKKLKVKFNYDR